MARIAGVNIPVQKRLVIALGYIYGIGPAKAKVICAKAAISESIRVKDLTTDQVNKLRNIIEEMGDPVEGDLRRVISMNIKRLQDIKCYRGIRHRLRLPVRGQRTHTNARTRKGRAIPIANKKKVTK